MGRGVHDSEEWEICRSNRLSGLIGEDRSEPLEILGKQVQFEDQPRTLDLEIIPNLLEGFPLSGATSVFEAAALHLAVRGTCDSWQGLKWLFLLNKVDVLEARSAIRIEATEIAARKVEAGIDFRLGQRVASLMLRLSGEKDDEESAECLEPGIDRHLTYEKDYLPNPGKSLFALEWRHASEVLRDKKLSILARLHRTRDFWLDPTFIPPPELADELRDFSLSFDVGELDAHRSQSRGTSILGRLSRFLHVACPMHLLRSSGERYVAIHNGRRNRGIGVRFMSVTNLC